jgi:hypothetical protein
MRGDKLVEGHSAFDRDRRNVEASDTLEVRVEAEQ